MSKRIKFLMILVVVLVTLSACSNSPAEKQSVNTINQNLRIIKIANLSLEVEVADTPESITLGLSYRKEIGADGMLFVMPSRVQPGFWMKGMRFGLDFLWIDCESSAKLRSGCQVVDITKQVPKPNDPNDIVNLKRYSPKQPITHVLEVPEGWVDTNGIKLDDLVVL